MAFAATRTFPGLPSPRTLPPPERVDQPFDVLRLPRDVPSGIPRRRRHRLARTLGDLRLAVEVLACLRPLALKRRLDLRKFGAEFALDLRGAIELAAGSVNAPEFVGEQRDFARDDRPSDGGVGPASGEHEQRQPRPRLPGSRSSRTRASRATSLVTNAVRCRSTSVVRPTFYTRRSPGAPAARTAAPSAKRARRRAATTRQEGAAGRGERKCRGVRRSTPARSAVVSWTDRIIWRDDDRQEAA